MITVIRAGLVVVALGSSLAPLGRYPGADTRDLHALSGSTLTIRGSTTIGAHWSCTANDVASTATMKAGARGFSPEGLATVSIAVPVFSLRCQSAAMERAMRKAMRAETDSTSAIVGNFSASSGAVGHAESGTRLDGALTVAGERRSVVLDVALSGMSDSTFRVQSTLPLLLSSFRITRPRVLFGMVRARDAITVEVDLLFAH